MDKKTETQRGEKSNGVTEIWLNKLFNSACRLFFLQQCPKDTTNSKHQCKKAHQIVKGNIFHSKDKFLKAFITLRSNLLTWIRHLVPNMLSTMFLSCSAGLLMISWCRYCQCFIKPECQRCKRVFQDHMSQQYEQNENSLSWFQVHSSLTVY